MDMEYCGLRTSNVKASSRGGRSRKGNAQKPKKAHSRRSCYGTSDASLSNTENCRRSSDTKRCVIKTKTPHYDAKADARRAKSRAKNAAKRSRKAGDYELLPNPGLEGGRYRLRGGATNTVFMNVKEYKNGNSIENMLDAKYLLDNNLLEVFNKDLTIALEMYQAKSENNAEYKFFEKITSMKVEPLMEPFSTGQNDYHLKLLIETSADLSDNISKLMWILADEPFMLGDKGWSFDDTKYYHVGEVRDV